MVEKFWLPHRCRKAHLRHQIFCRPLLPFANKMREAGTAAGALFGTEKMDVVGHYDIATDEPTVVLFGTALFFAQDVDRIWIVQDGPSVLGADGDEIDRMR